MTLREKPKMPKSENKPSAVGYRQPLVQHQFKKGLSGNPRGRGRGARNLATELALFMERRVRTEDGETITVRRALAKLGTNKAAAGDLGWKPNKRLEG